MENNKLSPKEEKAQDNKVPAKKSIPRKPAKKELRTIPVLIALFHMN